MNVLSVGIKKYFLNNLQEYFAANNDNILFSADLQEAIKILHKTEIKLIIMQFRTLDEMKLIKYINDYFPNIQIIVFTSEKDNDLMKIIQKSKFQILKQPFRFSELNKLLEITKK